jgi:hypothetical protein
MRFLRLAFSLRRMTVERRVGMLRGTLGIFALRLGGMTIVRLTDLVRAVFVLVVHMPASSVD